VTRASKLLLTTALAACVVLHLGSTSATAAPDSTASSACDRIAEIRTVAGINVAKLQRAAGELGRSFTPGARAIARQLEDSFQQEESRSRLSALRDAQRWCDRTTTTTTRPAPTTAPFVQPEHYEGRGDGDVELPASIGVALARIAVRGTDEFTVRAIGDDGQPLGTLVDVTTDYEGTRPLNFEEGPTTTRLEVTSDGAWTIDVVDLDDASRVGAPAHYDGSGDEVLLLVGDGTRATFRAAAGGRFTVEGYGIFKARLVDERTPYSETIVLPSEAKYVLEVRATGPWSLDVS
jgi:hypothetical protein